MSRKNLDRLKGAFMQALMHGSDYFDNELVLWIFLTDAEVKSIPAYYQTCERRLGHNGPHAGNGCEWD